MEIKKWSFNKPYHLLFGKPLFVESENGLHEGPNCWDEVPFRCLISAVFMFRNFLALGLCKSNEAPWWPHSARQGKAGGDVDPIVLSSVLNVSEGTKDNQVTCIAHLPVVFLAPWLWLAIPKTPQMQQGLFFKSFRERKFIFPWLLTSRIIFSAQTFWKTS